MKLNKESTEGGYVCPVRGMLNTKTGAYETVITEPKVEEVAEIPAGAKKSFSMKISCIKISHNLVKKWMMIKNDDCLFEGKRV